MYIIIYDFGTSSVKTCLFHFDSEIHIVANSTAEECAAAPLDMAKPVISRDADGSCARRSRAHRTDDSHRVHGDGS